MDWRNLKIRKQGRKRTKRNKDVGFAVLCRTNSFKEEVCNAWFGAGVLYS
jgi:hypothetical protein